MEPWLNRSSFNGMTGDPEVLRILFARMQQRKVAELEAAHEDFLGHYDSDTWKAQVTIADAEWLKELGILPL